MKEKSCKPGQYILPVGQSREKLEQEVRGIYVTECRILFHIGFLRIVNFEHIKTVWLLSLLIFVTVPLREVLHFWIIPRYKP